MNRKQFTFWLAVLYLVWLLGGTAAAAEYRTLQCQGGICYQDQPTWDSQAIVASQPASPPHAAVCRVMTRDRKGKYSYGSGTLIETSKAEGLVVTAKHVIVDAESVEVLFPSGERLAATVFDADPVFDCALLLIYKPKTTEAVAICDDQPAVGERLFIAGYGDPTQRYLQQSCRFSHFAAPSQSGPFELIEVNYATARQGDSGGPIFNGRYELVGCLYASSHVPRQTVGCGCHPIRRMLDRIRARRQQRRQPAKQPPQVITRPAPRPLPATDGVVTNEAPPLPGPVDDEPEQTEATPPAIVEVVPKAEPPAVAATDEPRQTIKDRIKDRVEDIVERAQPAPPRPVDDAGSLLAWLWPKLLTAGLAAGGITLPSWLVFLLTRGGYRAIRRLLDKHNRPPDPPASTATASTSQPEQTNGQPVSSGPTTVNFTQHYALSDAYAKELADKRANAGASIPQEALLSQLYREAFAGIKSGAMKTLGGANVVNDIEMWVQKEFMRRHGVQL